MPSSKCQQVSLTLGELYNDIRTALGITSSNKYMLKILSDYAKRFDDIIEQTEKACYDRGWEDAKLLITEKNLSTISIPKEIGTEKLMDVEA